MPTMQWGLKTWRIVHGHHFEGAPTICTWCGLSRDAVDLTECEGYEPHDFGTFSQESGPFMATLACRKCGATVVTRYGVASDTSCGRRVLVEEAE